jgi:hypothetical protein
MTGIPRLSHVDSEEEEAATMNRTSIVAAVVAARNARTLRQLN